MIGLKKRRDESRRGRLDSPRHDLQADTLVVQNEQEAFTAMIALKTGACSFSDALIGALGAWAGCSATLTFDKKAKRLKQFNAAP
jgi:predicted nucleic-acid-binding protein